MKLQYFFTIVILFAGLTSGAQHFAVSASTQPKCFGECNGSITFTTGTLTGPFTASVTNSGSCPNSTVQSSTPNSITISSICACAAQYSFTIYTGSVVASLMLYQFPNYAAQPLALFTNSITAISCDTCCDGSVVLQTTGGNLSGAPTFSINGNAVANVNPATGLCPGNYTACARDSSGCVNCKLFAISDSPSAVGEIEPELWLSLAPNPAYDKLTFEMPAGADVCDVEIFNIAGDRVFSRPAIYHQSSGVIDISSLPDGWYYIQARGSGQRIVRSKFIKASQ